MFINMMMKSMRDATPQDGPMDSQETKTFTSMLDQQMSQKLAKRGIGLADVLVRQLSAQETGKQALEQMNAQALAIGGGAAGAGAAGLGAQDATRLQRATDAMSTDRAASATGVTGSARGTHGKPAHVRAFQEKLGDAAEEAEQAPACRPSSCWARPRWKPAGASA
jgi:flagellar protein FlgJ